MRQLLFFLLSTLISLTFSTHQISLDTRKLSVKEFATRYAFVETLRRTGKDLPFKYGTIPLNSSSRIEDVIPITNFLDTQFYGNIEIGTPSQNLGIMFDTGSSNTFVLAPNCTGVACYGRKLYNYTDSSTFYLNGTHINLSYGSGDFTGFLGGDDIKLGESLVTDMLFALIDNPDSFTYIYARFDGIIGLAYESIAVDKIPPFFQLMIEQGLLEDASFSFYLTKEVDQKGSALVLGGVEERYAASNFSYVNLTHETFYMTDLDDLIIGNKSFIPGKMNIILDSGTSVIVGPQDLIKNITAMFPYRIACEDVDSYHNLTFVIGGIKYEIPPGLYIVQNFGRCLLGIIGADFDAELQNTIILGDVFLRAYYTHFDYGNRRLGFAKAANISNITTTDDTIVPTTTFTTTTTTTTTTNDSDDEYIIYY